MLTWNKNCRRKPDNEGEDGKGVELHYCYVYSWDNSRYCFFNCLIRHCCDSFYMKKIESQYVSLIKSETHSRPLLHRSFIFDTCIKDDNIRYPIDTNTHAFHHITKFFL